MSWNIQSLFSLHAESVASALRRRGIDRDTADDLTQDTFLRMLGSTPTESPVVNLRAYLFRVSRNLMLDHLRRNASNPVRAADPSELSRVADLAAGADRQLSDRERLEIALAVLEQMPPRQRRVFELHRIEGMTLTAVAEDLGISTTRTWELVHDAYRQIKARLDEA
jgi:RNA polymerase sigma factor (sigma-70 family)